MATTVDPSAAAAPTAPPPRRPLVLIHGYSSNAKAFDRWRGYFEQVRDTTDIHVGQYVSLSNEVTVKDIAEGLDRALERRGIGPDTEFDAVVHSTGMLVVRAWLTAYPERRARLKHLIGLAPATNGSPLAHKGRSWLGALFKGNHHLGPDFMEAGNEVLDGLELGGRFTWELAHRDLFVDPPVYGPDHSTPWVFIFVGDSPYSGLSRLVSEPGTDGTVRWAGVSLNSRKITLDLSRGPAPGVARVTLGEFRTVNRVPLVFVKGRNHGTIMDDPPADLQELVLGALFVHDADDMEKWCARAEEISAAGRPDKAYQQFVVRLVDERGDSVPDFHTRIMAQRAGGGMEHLERFDEDVHAYARDKSYRNFHVDVGDYLDGSAWERFELHLTASSGSKLVGYRGFSLADGDGAQDGLPVEEIRVDLMPVLRGGEFQFFHPFTTTFIEIRVNREPLPVGGANQVCEFP